MWIRALSQTQGNTGSEYFGKFLPNIMKFHHMKWYDKDYIMATLASPVHDRFFAKVISNAKTPEMHWNILKFNACVRCAFAHFCKRWQDSLGAQCGKHDSAWLGRIATAFLFGWWDHCQWTACFQQELDSDACSQPLKATASVQKIRCFAVYGFWPFITYRISKSLFAATAWEPPAILKLETIFLISQDGAPVCACGEKGQTIQRSSGANLGARFSLRVTH